MLTLPVEASRTELGRVASWMLERYVEGELTAEQASDPTKFFPIDNVDQRILIFGVFRRPITRVLGFEEVNGWIARFSVLDDRKRPMLVRICQHPDHPGRVCLASMVLNPPGINVRSATPSDAEPLRKLELATPVLHSGFSIAYDRPDPFAQDRLRPLPIFRSVAEADGTIAGTHTDACHVLHTDTGPVPVVYRHHSRVHPDFQGAGVMPAMNGFQSEVIRRDGVERNVRGYTAAGNDKIDAYASGGSSGQKDIRWINLIVRVSLNCDRLGRTPEVRTASDGDANRLAALFDMTFERSVFWPRETPVRLAARMNQSPDDYSWRNVLMNEHAYVGVWDAGWNIIHTDSRSRQTTRVATVLDWAFDPDHPEALADCLAAACSVARRAGIDRLYAYYGSGVAGTETFENLGDEFERFRISTPIPEPPDAAERGIYIDPIYF